MYNKNFFSFILLTIFLTLPSFLLALTAPADFQVVEEYPIAIELNWSTDSALWHHFEIERKTGAEPFEKIVNLPSKMSRYTDLGLADGTTYTYRIRLVFDLEESEWALLTASTKVGPTLLKNVKTDYGAVGDGVIDDTLAIREAIEDIQNAGGGTIYFPSGTYKVSPQASKEHIFEITGKDITLLGDGPENTIISCYVLGGKDPETNWEELFDVWSPGKSYAKDSEVIWKDNLYKASSSGTSGDTAPTHTIDTGTDGALSWIYADTPRGYKAIFRGFAFSFGRFNNVRNIVFKGLRVTGNARPTGEMGWYTRTDFINGWDTSHKGLALGFGGDQFNNILIEDCVWDSFRGEIIYSGSINGGKLKLKNSKFYGTNSSAISTSADFECDGIEVWDASNACIESAYYDMTVSQNKIQYGIFRNSTFEPRRSLLLDNPLLTYGKAGRFGIVVFNQPESSMIIEDCTIKHSFEDGMYFAYAQYNLNVIGNTLIDCASEGYINGNFLKFVLHDKPDYKLLGGLQNVLIKDNVFRKTEKSGGAFIQLTCYIAVLMENILVDNNEFHVTGDGSMDNLIPAYFTPEGDLTRSNFIISNNYAEGDYGLVAGGGSPMPEFINNNFQGSIADIGGWFFKKTNIGISSPYGYMHTSNENHDVLRIGGSNLGGYYEGLDFALQLGWMENYKICHLEPEEGFNYYSRSHDLEAHDLAYFTFKDGMFYLDKLNDTKYLNCFQERGLDIAEPSTYENWDGVADGDLVELSIYTDGVIIKNSDNIHLDGGLDYISNSKNPESFVFRAVGEELIELERYSCDVQLIYLD